jgi:hypothetical protein
MFRPKVCSKERKRASWCPPSANLLWASDPFQAVPFSNGTDHSDWSDFCPLSSWRSCPLQQARTKESARSVSSGTTRRTCITIGSVAQGNAKKTSDQHRRSAGLVGRRVEIPGRLRSSSCDRCSRRGIVAERSQPRPSTRAFWQKLRLISVRAVTPLHQYAQFSVIMFTSTDCVIALDAGGTAG